MDKYVLITGSNGGIGKGLCEVFKLYGFSVIGTGTRDKSSHEHVDIYFKADLTDIESQRELFNNVLEYNIVCVIHNAAIQICKPVWEYKNEDFERTYNCNVRFLFTLLNNNIEQLKHNRTVLINIGSVHSVCTSKNISMYASSKACLTGLTKNLAIDLGEYGIRVVTVSPGAVDTQMLRKGLERGHKGGGTGDELVDKLAMTHPLGEVGQPYQIASFVYSVFENSFINGVNLLIDGGVSVMLSSE